MQPYNLQAQQQTKRKQELEDANASLAYLNERLDEIAKIEIIVSSEAWKVIENKIATKLRVIEIDIEKFDKKTEREISASLGERRAFQSILAIKDYVHEKKNIENKIESIKKKIMEHGKFD